MKQSNSTNGNPDATKPQPWQGGFQQTGPKSQDESVLLQGKLVGMNNAWPDYEPDTNLPYGYGKNPSIPTKNTGGSYS